MQFISRFSPHSLSKSAFTIRHLIQAFAIYTPPYSLSCLISQSHMHIDTTDCTYCRPHGFGWEPMGHFLVSRLAQSLLKFVKLAQTQTRMFLFIPAFSLSSDNSQNYGHIWVHVIAHYTSTLTSYSSTHLLRCLVYPI